MKKLIQSSLFLASLFLLAQCTTQDSYKGNTLTHLNGNISNLDVYPTTREMKVTIRDFRGAPTVVSCPINEDGSFSLSFDLFHTQDVDVFPFVGKILMEPGSSVHLELDFKRIANVDFSGDLQEENEQLFSYINSNYYLHDFENREAMNMDPVSYIAFCKNEKEKMLRKREKYISEYKPSKTVLRWTEDYIDVYYYQALINFMYRYIYTRQSSDPVLFLQSYKGNFEGIDKVFKKGIINSEAYNILDIYTGVLALDYFKFESTENMELATRNFIHHINRTFEDNNFREYLLANFFYQSLVQNNPYMYEVHQSFIDSNINLFHIKIPLQQFYNNLSFAMEHPGIETNKLMYALNSSPVGSTIKDLLEANKGKVIYVDCWSTWCSPCLSEMPSSKKLFMELGGNDISFVFLCLNSEKEAWEEKLEELNLPGQQLFLEETEGRDLMRIFEIKGVPHYILFDKDGNLRDSGNYLRPSNPETKKKIEALL